MFLDSAFGSIAMNIRLGREPVCSGMYERCHIYRWSFRREILVTHSVAPVTLKWRQKLVFTEGPSRKSERAASDGGRRFGASGVELFQISALAS